MQTFLTNQIAWNSSKPSIFLTGPIVKSFDGKITSWQTNAIHLLSKWKFTGQILVSNHQNCRFTTIEQVKWEYFCLEQATAIVFWSSGELDAITQLEFDNYIRLSPRRCTYGRTDANHLDHVYKKYTKQIPCETLEETLELAILNTFLTSSP